MRSVQRKLHRMIAEIGAVRRAECGEVRGDAAHSVFRGPARKPNVRAHEHGSHARLSSRQPVSGRAAACACGCGFKGVHPGRFAMFLGRTANHRDVVITGPGCHGRSVRSRGPSGQILFSPRPAGVSIRRGLGRRVSDRALLK